MGAKCGRIPGHASTRTTTTLHGQLHTHALVLMTSIDDDASCKTANIEYFQNLMLLNENDFTPKICTANCDNLSFNPKKKYRSSRTGIICDGYFDHCSNFGHKSLNEAVEYCKIGNYIAYSKTVHQEYGNKTACKKNTQYVVGYISLQKCDVCACVCTANRAPGYNTWKISLASELSDTANNHVVTGVKFVVRNQTIHLKIKENRLGSGLKGSWKEVNFERAVDSGLMSLSYNFKTIYLDEVSVPADYVITGVKFDQVPHMTAGSQYALRLSVHGTQVNFKNATLLNNNEWFTRKSENSSQYTMWWPEFIHGVLPNRSIEFQAADLYLDFGKTTVPAISLEPVESCVKEDIALKAMRLRLVKMGDEQILIPNIAPVNKTEDKMTKKAMSSANILKYQFFIVIIVPVLIILNLFD